MNNCIAEYFWVDGTGLHIRSKSRNLNKIPKDISDIPIWNFDGSSCYLAETKKSEIYLEPVSYLIDPFRGAPNIIVHNELFYYDENFNKIYTSNCFRNKLKYIFEQAEKDNIKPWFGIEQEYTLFKKLNMFHIQPYGWPEYGYPRPQGPYYCSIGHENNHGRKISNEHYKKCLEAGIKLFGSNAETMPGQWEFQIGTLEGMEICDQLWFARYILVRICEDYKIEVTFMPKPFKGNWNGAGSHVNFSTEKTRSENGLQEIIDKLKNFDKFHKRTIQCYGDKNNERLDGKNEFSNIKEFSFGIQDRTASIRIPTLTVINKSGYFEDRRPASNIDPYVVCAILIDSFCYKGKNLDNIVKEYKIFENDKIKRVPNNLYK